MFVQFAKFVPSAGPLLERRTLSIDVYSFYILAVLWHTRKAAVQSFLIPDIFMKPGAPVKGLVGHET